MSYKQKILSVIEGGTGVNTLTSHGVLLGNGTGNISPLAAAATGTIAIGNTGADLSFSTSSTITSITLSGGTALDTYLEGSWTPALALSIPGTSSFTYSVQYGKYIKVGNCVYIQGKVTLTNYTQGTGSNSVTMTGLPLAVGSQSCQICVLIQNATFGVSVLYYTGNAASVTTTIQNFTGMRSGASGLNLAAAGPSNTTNIVISGWYFTG